MDIIRIPVFAYILELCEGDEKTCTPARSDYWTRELIAQAFEHANTIWEREAAIRFEPVTITERRMNVPADERGVYYQFMNQLPPKPDKPGIGVGFVNDLPGKEGGMAGGRMAAVAGKKAASGIASFGGALLAHELGHILIIDHDHELAKHDSANLMFPNYDPKTPNAGKLNADQKAEARKMAPRLSGAQKYIQ